MEYPKITRKAYYCPSCGWKTATETNHFGEIYSGCEECSSGVLYCGEPEAIAKTEQREQSKATMHRYKFNIEDGASFVKYEALIKMLKDTFKYNCFNTQCRIPIPKNFFQFIDDGEELTVYDRKQFTDQCVTNRGRLHSWAEIIYPNTRIKEGYYLSFDDQGETK